MVDLKKDVAAAVQSAAESIAKSPMNGVDQSDVPAIVNGVTPKVTTQVNSIVKNLTNQEPWYQSRVIIGTVVGLVFSVGRFASDKFDLVDQNQIVDIVMQVVSIGGVLYALYGRLTVQKPIGE